MLCVTKLHSNKMPSHAARKCHQTCLMSPCVATTGPKHSSLLALTFSTTSRKSLATHVILACIEMTASE